MVSWERAVVASFTLGIVNSFLGLTGGCFFLWKHEKYPGLGHEIFVLFFVGVVEAVSWIYEAVKFDQMDEDDAPPSYSDFRKIAPFRNFLLVQIVLFWCLRAQRGPLAKHNVLVRILSLSHTLLSSFVFIILAWFETFDMVYWEISMAFLVNILVTLLGFLFGIHNKHVQKLVYCVCNCCNCHYLYVMYIKFKGKDKQKQKEKELEKGKERNNQSNGDNNDSNDNKKKKSDKYHEIGYLPLRYGVKGMLILICIHSIFLANLDIMYDNNNLFWLWDSYYQWTLYSHIVNRSLTFCYLIMIYFVINDRSNFLPWLCPCRHSKAKLNSQHSMSFSTALQIDNGKKKNNSNNNHQNDKNHKKNNNKSKNDSNNVNKNDNDGDNGVIYREMSSVSVMSPVSASSPPAESQSPQAVQSSDELKTRYEKRKNKAERKKYKTIKTSVIGSEQVGKTLYVRALWQGDFIDNQDDDQDDHDNQDNSEKDIGSSDLNLEPKCGNLGNLNNYNRYNLYDYYCRWHRHLKTAFVFWDTIGDLRFTLNSLDRMRNSHVIMLMYDLDECLQIGDVTKAHTLKFLENFNQRLKTILELKDDNEMSETFPVLLAGVTKHSMGDIMMKDKLIETHKKVVGWSKSGHSGHSGEQDNEKSRLLSLFRIVDSQIIHSLDFDATNELSIFTLLDTFFKIEDVERAQRKRKSSVTLAASGPSGKCGEFKSLLNKFNLGNNNRLYPSLPHKKIDKKLKNQGKFISLILRKHIDTDEAMSDEYNTNSSNNNYHNNAGDSMKRNYVATQLSMLQETEDDEKRNSTIIYDNDNGNGNGNEIEEKERVGDGDNGAMAFMEYINQKAEENSTFSSDIVIGPISVRYKEIKRKRFYIFCRFIVCLAFGILFPLILVMQTTVFWLYSDIWGYSNDGLLEWFSSNYSFFTLGQLPMDVLFGLPWFERPASDPLQGGLRSCFEGSAYSNPDSNAAFSNTEIDWFLRQTVSQKIGRTIIAFLCCVLWSLMGYNVIYYVKYSNNEDSILFGANEISNVEALGGVFLFIWLWIMVSSWYAGNTVITNSNLHLNAQAPERQSMKMCYKDMSKNDGTKNKNNNNNNIYTNVDIFLQSYTFYRNEAKLHSFGKGISKKLVGILILSSLILAFIPSVVRAAQHLPAFGADYDYIEDYLTRVTGSNSTITIDDYSDYNYNFTSAEIHKYAKAQENTASRAILINLTMIFIIQIVALRIVQNSFREYKLLMNYITKIIEISHDGDSTKTSENNNVGDSSHGRSHSRTASVTKKRETKFKLINSPSNGSITTRTATNKTMDMPNMASTKLKKAAASASSLQLSRVRSRRGSTVKRVHSLLGDSQNQYESNSIIAEQEDMKQLESQSGLVFLSLDDPFNLIAFMEVRDYGFVFGRQLFGELELFMVIAVFAIVVQTAYAIALLWRTDGIHEFGQSIFVAYWCLVMTIAWALRVLYYGVQFDKLQSRQVEALIHQTACIRSSIITTAIFEGPERWNMFKVGTWDRLYKLKRAYSDFCKSNYNNINNNNNNNNNKNGMFEKEIYYSNEKKEMLEDEQDSFNQYMKLMELFTKEVELNIINPNIIGIRISGTLAKAAIGTGIGFVVAIVKVLFF